MAEMQHWRKTSTLEPLPVKKRVHGSGSDSSKTKIPPPAQTKLQGALPAVRGTTVVSGAPDGANAEDRKGKRSLTQQTCPEDKGEASAKSRKLHGRDDSKNEKRVVLKDEKPSAVQIRDENDPWISARKRVNNLLSRYRHYCNILMEENKKKKDFRRVDIIAGEMIKKSKGWAPHKPVLGSFPGVEVGDKFNYRMELHLLGVHAPIRWGIDTMESGGWRLAISVVDSGGYDNYRTNPYTLIYCGQGSTKEDQMLKQGNLALMNSIKAKNPVRVIRGSKKLNTPSFVYDGLYTVEKMEEEPEFGGNLIKFKLMRIPGQPSLPSL